LASPGTTAPAPLVDLVGRVASDEGFRVNPLKTSVRRSSERQRLAGVVVNRHPNVDRRAYDQLKAILHNCARHGPGTQNHQSNPEYQAHLLGRISHVTHLNPSRGERLRAEFDQIDWSGPR
jgi:RNA-directed DNA polymerase